MASRAEKGTLDFDRAKEGGPSGMVERGALVVSVVDYYTLAR
jgi:hypothetical protein